MSTAVTPGNFPVWATLLILGGCFAVCYPDHASSKADSGPQERLAERSIDLARLHALMETHQYRKVIQEGEQLQALTGFQTVRIRARYFVGVAYSRLGEFEQAAAELDAVDASPQAADFPQLSLELGIVRYHLGQHVAALGSLRLAETQAQSLGDTSSLYLARRYLTRLLEAARPFHTTLRLGAGLDTAPLGRLTLFPAQCVTETGGRAPCAFLEQIGTITFSPRWMFSPRVGYTLQHRQWWPGLVLEPVDYAGESSVPFDLGGADVLNQRLRLSLRSSQHVQLGYELQHIALALNLERPYRLLHQAVLALEPWTSSSHRGWLTMHATVGRQGALPAGWAAATAMSATTGDALLGPGECREDLTGESPCGTWRFEATAGVERTMGERSQAGAVLTGFHVAVLPPGGASTLRAGYGVEPGLWGLVRWGENLTLHPALFGRLENWFNAIPDPDDPSRLFPTSLLSLRATIAAARYFPRSGIRLGLNYSAGLYLFNIDGTGGALGRQQSIFMEFGHDYAFGH